VTAALPVILSRVALALLSLRVRPVLALFGVRGSFGLAAWLSVRGGWR